MLSRCGHDGFFKRANKRRGACAHQRHTSERQLAQLDGQASLLSAQEALRLCPDDNESLVVMGRALAAADRLEEACRMLERARAQGSRSRLLYFVLVNSYDVLNDHGRAASAAGDFLDDHPDDFPMRSNYANALMRSGRPDEAVQELDRIRSAHPDDVAVLDASAQALFAATRFEEARQRAGRAIALEPGRIESRLLCARALLALERRQAARAMLESLLMQHPRLEEGLTLMRRLDEASL